MNPFPKSPFYVGFLILVVTFILVSYSLIAQSFQQPTAEERAQQWDKWMKENLSLTYEQEVKVQEINLRYAKQNEELRLSGASQREKFKQLKASGKAKTAELKNVLTEDQLKIYKKKKKAVQRQFFQSLAN